MRILFLSPYPPSRVRVRPYQWIRHLARLGHQVHLLALLPPGEAVDVEADLGSSCVAVETFALSGARTIVNAAGALPRLSVPLQLAYSHHPRAERRAAKLAASGRFDLVHIEHMRGVALATRVGAIPVVLDEVDAISTLFAAAAQMAPSRGARFRARLDLARTRRFEARAPYTFSRVVVTSAHEAEAIVALAGEDARPRVAVAGNGVDPSQFAPLGGEAGRAVVFTGKLSYHANAAAALRLVEGVMPLVWRHLPDTPVLLAGKDPPERIRALGRDPRVTVMGYVPDMRTVFQAAAVAVCPLVYGVGIQSKVLEAMACGIPAVMSTATAKPLSGTIGVDYLAEETDEGIAAAVIGLLDDEGKRQRFGEAGRAYVRRHHDWMAHARELVTIYEDALAAGPWDPGRLLR